MPSPGVYFPPGISVVCTAQSEQTRPADLRTFLAATVPHVEQLCLVVDSRALLDAALDFGPKVRVRLLPATTRAEQAWVASAQLADHQWSFQLMPDELLQAADFARLPRVLPHAGPRFVTIADENGRHAQARLWRTAWNLAPDGKGGLVPAGPAIDRPRHRVDLAQLPETGAEGELTLRTPPVAQQGPVLVCGMHRSGTSMVTRVLNLLGLALSDCLAGVHTEAHASNPKGHWEDMRARTLHSGILKAAAGVGTDWEWLHDVAVSSHMVSASNRRALMEIALRTQGRGRWAIKDPRISLLLPVWQSVVPDACMVVCVRDPLAVARSLLARDVLPLPDGLRLWRAYNRRVLESTFCVQERVLFVSYEALLRELQPQVARIARFLGLGGALDQMPWQAISDFVDNGLRHHDTQGDLGQELTTALGDLAVAGEVEALCALQRHLLGLCGLGVEADTPAGEDRADQAGPVSEQALSSWSSGISGGDGPVLSIVIPYYENHRTLRACLESFGAQRTEVQRYEIVVVDDGSQHPARPLIDGLHLPVQVQLVDGHGNLGQAAATNLGIRHARAPIVLLTCADIMAHRDLVDVHLREHCRVTGHVAVGGFIPYADTVEMTPFMEFLAGDGPQFAFGLIRDPENMQPSFCYSPNFSARKQDLLDCGLFDERFRYGFQDTDLGIRLARAGVRLLYRAQAIAYHDHPCDLPAFCRRQQRVARGYWTMAEKHPWHLSAEAAVQALAEELPRLPPLPTLIDAAKRVEISVKNDPTLHGELRDGLHRRYRLALHRAFLEGLRENGGSCP